jgi:uncharacterized membrane protein
MAIFLILFLSLILRLISLNQSLWLDEATTALVSKMSLADLITKFMPGDFHPPLYYLLMKGWGSLFGTSEIFLRIPSVIFGVLTIYFIYLIAKKIFDLKTAVVASVLAATSGLLIYYSQETRMYSLAALLVTMLVYFFLKRRWILFSIIIPILGMTDYMALLVIPVFLIFSGENRKKVLLSFIPSVLVFTFWAPVFLKQIMGGFGVGGSNWWNILGILSLKNLGLIPVKFILGRISFDNKILYAAISTVSVLLYSYFLVAGRPLKKAASKLMLGWLIVPILLGIIISIKIPVLYYFRFLFCLPALYILVARGIRSFSGKLYLLFLSAAILINISSSLLYLFDGRFKRENWRGITGVIGESVVIFPSNSQKEALTYYGKENQIVYFGQFRGNSSKIWLSRYVWEVFDGGDLARISIEKLGYNKVRELNLNGVEFWEYIK